jgi:hypothetical protein
MGSLGGGVVSSWPEMILREGCGGEGLEQQVVHGALPYRWIMHHHGHLDVVLGALLS